MSTCFQELNADNRKIAGDPPDNTCPLIDKIIRDLTDAAGYAKEVEKDTEYEHHRLGRDCRYEINSALDKIEKLRKENERLRELGREWYANACDIARQADERISELENEEAKP